MPGSIYVGSSREEMPVAMTTTTMKFGNCMFTELLGGGEFTFQSTVATQPYFCGNHAPLGPGPL